MAKEPPDNIFEFQAGRGKPDPAWIGHLARTAQGGWHNTLANALLILKHDPPLRESLAYNDMTGQTLITRAPPVFDYGFPPLGGTYPRLWEAPDVALIQSYLQRVWSPRFGRETTEQAMITVAAQYKFHPIRDWLNAIKWDGSPRLDTWLVKAFGTPDDDYHAAVGTKFAIAAVRRVRHPGCKFDHMPIFEGPQEIGKSTAGRAFFGEEWFSDSIPTDLSSRDAAFSLAGPWCIELAEIDALLRNETETIKAFITRQVDRYRPPYGRNFVERPRQCVLMGTTNSDDYLRDATGNRRFWPVRCKHVDLDWIRENREQLWAEAAARELSGEAIWIHEIDAANKAKLEQEDRLPDDVWSDKIVPWLATRLDTSIPEILSECLFMAVERQGKREQMRVATTLRRLGWKKALKREGGYVSKRWSRKDEN